MIRNNEKAVRPVIIKLTNFFDKQLTFKNLKHLKNYNEALNLKARNPGYVFVTEHLPRELQLEKERLLPIFRNAKAEGKKATSKIPDGGYHLYIDGAQFHFK